jgi:DNA polymerase III epsilon subunit-like protein
MVDLETMGKKHNAPIVAIGAVVFDPQPALLEKVSIKSYALNPL